MSIADRFEHEPEAGFVGGYDGQSARWQFQVSIALILVLGLAAFALGFLAGLDRPTPTPPAGPKNTNSVHFAETLLVNPS
jgi:hypothetical protein